MFKGAARVDGQLFLWEIFKQFSRCVGFVSSMKQLWFGAMALWLWSPNYPDACKSRWISALLIIRHLCIYCAINVQFVQFMCNSF